MTKSNDDDLIELNNQIAKLKQELTNKDEFLSYVHHELNGFVHNTHFLSDYLCKNWNEVPNDNINQYLVSIVESAEYLKLLSEDLFNLSRFKSGTMQFDFSPTNLIDIIQDTIDRCSKMFLVNRDLKILLEENKITKAFVNGDNQRLRQLLFNLIINSVKYSEKGKIIVKIEKIEQEKISYWQVSVIDQGIGIAESNLESIFEPSVKANSSNNSIPSFGLGLALCKQIVTAHNGTIKVVNNSDRGTTFSFVIPTSNSNNKE